MPLTLSRRKTFLTVSLVLLASLPSFGCVGGVAHLIYFFKGNLTPAAYSDFEDKRVAVVCVADQGYASSEVSFALAGKVEKMLLASEVLKKVKGMQVVKQERIVDWINSEEWDQLDYKEVGRGVKADLVIAIDLTGFQVSQSNSPNLVQGRASITVRVIDMEKNEEVLKRRFPDFVYPKFGPKDITELSEDDFQDICIEMIAGDIARLFYKHEFSNGYADDTVRL